MNRKAFTLVEILIVVIILGILAAIVIPQFTEASNDARASALDSDLQTIRSQIELYKMQHTGGYPTVLDVAATSQLLNNTNLAGAVGTTAAHNLGPYLQSFPANPYVSGAAASQVTTGVSDTIPGDCSTGWYYNTTNGNFQAAVTE